MFQFIIITYVLQAMLYYQFINGFGTLQQKRVLIENRAINSKVRYYSSPLKMGIIDSFKKIVGATDPKEALSIENDKQLKIYVQKVEMINTLEEEYEKLSNQQLEEKTKEFRNRLQNGATLDDILVEAFAVVREASWRVLELRHFDVQLMGGMALHDGRLAEMATGEGKTLVAVLPVYLNALSGEGAFVVTTNDYLARRDGEIMGQIYKFLGLKVGIIQSSQKESERRHGYNCDVTYVANQELGFDFLRDNLAMSLENIVQTRPYNFCVVDEADSILIDEARTPLIISRKGNGPTAKYVSAQQIAINLQADVHYEINLKDQKIELTPNGFKFAEQIVGKSLYDLTDPWAFYIINALKAKELYRLNQEYLIENNEVLIVDSFTGRALLGRRFTDGLQQAIEAKEKLPISSVTQVVAKVTYQNLFRLFPQLSGMTGTAFTEAGEFLEVYQLKVLPIPTALPVARRDNPDAVFRTQQGKLKALLTNIFSTNQKQRPILIGTTSVDTSEELTQALRDLGIEAKVLNARPENVEKESEIVAQAGRLGAVTVATNMAGRGTDIKLGGSAEGIVKAITKQLFMIDLGMIERLRPVVVEPPTPPQLADSSSMESTTEESTPLSDVDEFNLALSPPPMESHNPTGSTVIGLEDSDVDDEAPDLSDPNDLPLPSILDVANSLQISLPMTLSKRDERNLTRAIYLCVDYLQNKSESTGSAISRLDIEELVSQASDTLSPIAEFPIRLLRNNLKIWSDQLNAVLKQEREQVRKLGGLYVIGTARHESRRIDNQLRGRCGRQGDPGSTRFFLSLEDDIFKVFGGDKMAGLLENFRVAEDMPIESDLVVQALDKVQSQVEDYYTANRQQVYRLDEVASYQRSAVYSQRRAYLTSSEEGVQETFSRYCSSTMDEIYSSSLVAISNKGKSMGGPVDIPKLHTKALQFFPNIKLTVPELEATPMTEIPQLLKIRLIEAIEDKKVIINSQSTWSFAAFFKYMALVQIDESWCKHLTRLDLLKEEMILGSFTAERDVMETYKERAMKLFSTLMDDVRRNTVYSLFIYKP